MDFHHALLLPKIPVGMIDYKPAVVLDIEVLYFTPLRVRNDKEGLGIVTIFLSYCVICICAIPAKPMK